MKFSDVALDYARGVVNGEVTSCNWVQAACKRHIKDLDNASLNYVFDQEKANRVCRFISGLRHVKGKWARDQLKISLEPWQVFILCCVFGWVDHSGNRRFRTVYIEVPRKNAKSTLTSGVGLYMLTCDGEEGAEVYSAATTRDQAKIIFQVAQQMARKDSGFREHFGIEVNAHNMNVLMSGSKFEPLSADASSLDGLNVHAGLIDELHAHKTREVFDVMETATGSREQPLLWCITTAGSNRAGICYEQHTYLTKILDGVVQDETYFGVIYTIDDGDQWHDDMAWRKANPNYGISVNPDDLARKCRKAQEMPSATNNFLTKHLNLWVNADTAWMDMRKWDACADPNLTIDDFKGEQCIIALDLASRVDIAALVQIFKRDGHYYVFGRYYLPEETIETSGNSQYDGWVRSGHMTDTPGNVIDFEYIKDDMRSYSSRFEVLEVPYDPFQATQLSVEMIQEGFPMVEMRPTILNFSEPMKELEGLVLSGKLHHNGCPILTWMVSNVVCHMDVKDNIYPRKERPENKIDGVVALIMAIGRWSVCEDTTSVYEHGDLLVL